MIADRAMIATARAGFPAGTRLILLYGPDAAASRDIADGIARQFANSADPLAVQTVDAADLARDPAALAAAANSVSLFGTAALIRVDDATDETAAAVTMLLGADQRGYPVLMTGGTLRKGAKLLAAVERATTALAFVSYLPDARGTLALVGEMAAELGLRPVAPAARMLIETTGGDRTLLRRELEKLALYVNATPLAPLQLLPADVAAAGAGNGDGDLAAFVDAFADGDAPRLDRQMRELADEGIIGITLLRAALRRLWLLLDLRLAVDGGSSASSAVDGARPPVFWKDKPAIVTQLAGWTTPGLRSALARLLATERAIKRSGTAGDVLVGQSMLGMTTRRRADALGS